MSPPHIDGILETAVYVDDMEAAHGFYGGILGLKAMVSGERLTAYDAGPAQTLLVFRRGLTSEDSVAEGGVVPGHHSDGPAHFAFHIKAEQVGAWRSHLAQNGVTITSEVTWPAGGKSLYFNDPAGNVLELACAPLWPNFHE
ncbi:VOC family protein [Roseibium sp.]|uniref:VOC family protein n=1 Tax=Roseibium sp. TaxID=1936156 RepID=UPI003A979D44